MKILKIALLVCAVILIPILIALAINFFHLFPSDVASVQIGSKTLTSQDFDKEIKNLWGVYAQKAAKDSKASQKAKDSLIESEIINQEASKLGITISGEEIERKLQEDIKQSGGTDKYQQIISKNGWSMDIQKDKIKNQMLKDKLVNKVISWRIVDSVSTYLLPASQNYNNDKKTVLTTLEKVRQLMIKGQDSSSSASLAVKGLNLNQKLVVTKNARVEKTTHWEDQIKTSIFATPIGKISPILNSKAEDGFVVVKILAGNNGNFDSFEQWLEAKKKEYIK